MPGWLIELRGDRGDLEEFPRCFPEGEIHALEEGTKVYLAGSYFDDCLDGAAIHDRAVEVLEQLSAVISLLWPGFEKPRIGTIYREREDGVRDAYIIVKGISSRTKLGAMTVNVSGQTSGPTMTRAQYLLQNGKKNPHLKAALDIWANPIRTWPRLYRILEEIESFLEQSVSDEGWCSNAERKLFMRTANTAEVAGSDARHGLGQFDPPRNPMDQTTAVDLVARLLERALEK